jgi:two-component system cell cycle sensor histidine kinase/response regulator CckA
MDLSAAVAAMKPTLREMIGANIALQLNLEREGLWVKEDARLIEQVVVNLIANARDAMPEGGTITVETSRVNVGPDFLGRKVRGGPELRFGWASSQFCGCGGRKRGWQARPRGGK